MNETETLTGTIGVTPDPTAAPTERTEEYRYPRDSVGSIMDPHFLTFRETDTVKDAVEMIRFLSNNQVPLLYAYVVDSAYRLTGVLLMRDLLVSADHMSLKDIMNRRVEAINVYRNRDEVAKEAIVRRFLAVPIVDNENHLLGVLKFGDIVQFAQEESSKDIQKMFGAGAEEMADSSVGLKIRKRLPWLNVNLATAFLAAAVIGYFEGIVAKVTALAIFLPVIAGQGGNTGAQSLAVVMRSIALEEFPAGQAGRVIFKETAAGLVNGIAVGAVTALAAWLWNGNPFLGAIVGAAMILTMMIGTFFGAIIPLSMKKMGLDPAQCSSIILTTFTDVFGFFILLGLAVLLQQYII